MVKKKYTAKDYKMVLNHLLESWSDQTMPNEARMLRDLKRNKKLMDEEYDFILEMRE